MAQNRSPRCVRALVSLALLLFAVAPLHAFYPQWAQTSVLRTTAILDSETGDVTGDGRDDLVAVTSESITLAAAGADGTLRGYAPIYAGTGLRKPVITDATGDARPDIIVVNAETGNIIVLPSNGDGTLGTPILSPVTLPIRSFAAGELNGDGRVDLAAWRFDVGMVLLIGDGAGRFTESATMSIPSIAGVVAGDADQNGYTDFLVFRHSPSRQEVYFSKGDGTFHPPVSLASPADTIDIRFADLDHDGDHDLVSCEYTARTVTVRRNTGSRTFAAPDVYPILDLSDTPYDPISLAVDDFDGNGHPDVVVLLSLLRSIVTLSGNGDGTLRPVHFASVENVDSLGPLYVDEVLTANLNGDSRPDLVVTGDWYQQTYSNKAGDVRFELRPRHPTISVGQTATILADLLPAGTTWDCCYARPVPRGTVTLFRGDDVAASREPDGVTVPFELAGLPAGVHSLTATFAGDEEFHPASSGPATQRVIAERSAVMLTSSDSSPEVPWGTPWTLSAEVTSEAPGALDGALWFTVDGERTSQHSGPSASWTLQYYPAGAYQFQVEFDGTDTQPPSRSAVIRKTIVPAETTTAFRTPWVTLVREGSRALTSVSVEAKNGGTAPVGIVRIFAGNTSMLSLSTYAAESGFELPELPPGVHYLRAVYESEGNWSSSTSAALRYEVLPAASFAVRARIAGEYIDVVAYPTAPAPSYRIYERVANGAWTQVAQRSYASFVRAPYTPSTTYAYRVEALDAKGAVIGTSDVDLVVTTPASEIDRGQVVRAAHFQELVSVTNLVRAHAGLQPLTMPGIRAGAPIAGSDLTQIRSGLVQALSAFGVHAPAFTGGAQGAPIRADDFRELRDVLR